MNLPLQPSPTRQNPRPTLIPPHQRIRPLRIPSFHRRHDLVRLIPGRLRLSRRHGLRVHGVCVWCETPWCGGENGTVGAVGGVDACGGLGEFGGCGCCCGCGFLVGVFLTLERHFDGVVLLA